MQSISHRHPRRQFFQNALLAATTAGSLAMGFSLANAADEGKPTDIGNRRELFVDDTLIERIVGDARRQLHHPVPKEIVLRHDELWEGTGSGYHSVFQDGDRYRMYYKAWHLEVTAKGVNTNRHPLYCCYAESKDGIEWTKPKLGLYDFEGSKENNITMASGKLGELNVDAGHPAIFKDENPDAPADARYKAIFRSSSPSGLLPFQSADGLHWSPMTTAPILGNLGAFDSQNLAFWDPTIRKYRAYWRIFTAGITTDKTWKPAGIRAIRTATSSDLINWGPHTDLTYQDSPPQQLYTNQIKPYYRAPHLLIGFPARYIERGWAKSMKDLPALQQRNQRAVSSERYGTAITDSLLMVSRDGVEFQRWNEAFLRPGPERADTWHYGHQYIGWHVVETKSDLAGAENELSMYATEAYWHGKGSAVRRYTLRLDGFVSINGAAGTGNELVTKTLKFSGNQLSLNFATSAAGGVRVEIQHANGSPIENYSLNDCDVLFGDTTERTVTWKGKSDLSQIAGQSVRLRFEVQDADVYSYQFHD